MFGRLACDTDSVTPYGRRGRALKMVSLLNGAFADRDGIILYVYRYRYSYRVATRLPGQMMSTNARLYIKEMRVTPFVRNLLLFNELYSHSHVCIGTPSSGARIGGEIKIRVRTSVCFWNGEKLNSYTNARATYVGHAEESNRNKPRFSFEIFKNVNKS